MAKANGKKLPKVQEHLQMSIMENMFKIRSAVKENLDGHQAITIKVSTKMMKEMAMEKWCGQMEADILDNGYEVSSMVMGK